MESHAQTISIAIAMVLYMGLLIYIGIRVAKKANSSAEDYFLAGRSIGPWVAALSAEASDMSGWLLMGLPGLAYFAGVSNAGWTALGLFIGTALNWIFVAKPLRIYSERTGSFTLPDFFSSRFGDDRKILMGLSALIILIFFSIYVGSCFVTCGKLFHALFGLDYVVMMVIGAAVVFAYTLMGGFLAESYSDLIQGFIMFFALLIIVVGGILNMGGIPEIAEYLQQFPGYLDWSQIATPIVDANGVQTVINGIPGFSASTAYPLLNIVSAMAWGLGYFGMPQVVLRFMAIDSPKSIKNARNIAIVWAGVSLFAAVSIGLIGRATMPTAFLTGPAAENIFISMSLGLLPAFLAGIVVSGILAATMSSSDSYMLIASSSAAQNIYKGLLKKDASDEHVLLVSRIVMTFIVLFGILVALDQNSSIFSIVSYAWAGFGASLSPVMLAALFWRRSNWQGALAGMIVGALTIYIWPHFIAPLGGVFNIYELLPGFVFASIALIVVTLITPAPKKEVTDLFDAVKADSKN